MRRRPQTMDPRPWAYPGHPRVLVEHGEPDEALALATAIRKAGCVIAICCGPDAHADRPTRCPLHRLEPCAAVEGADVVVTVLDFDEEDARQVLKGLRLRYPHTPVVAAVTPGQSLDLAEALEECEVVPANAEHSAVVEAVLRLAGAEAIDRGRAQP